MHPVAGAVLRNTAFFQWGMCYSMTTNFNLFLQSCRIGVREIAGEYC